MKLLRYGLGVFVFYVVAWLAITPSEHSAVEHFAVAVVAALFPVMITLGIGAYYPPERRHFPALAGPMIVGLLALGGCAVILSP